MLSSQSRPCAKSSHIATRSTQSSRRNLPSQALGARRALSSTTQLNLARAHAPGLAAIGLYFFMFSAMRDLRDAFQPEARSREIARRDCYTNAEIIAENCAQMWLALNGSPPPPAAFLLTELPAMLVVLLLPALTSHRCPRASLLRIHALLLFAPLALAGLGTMRAAGLLSGATWFAATGVAIFCGYIPVTALFFDKLVGALRLNGTAAGFIQARRDRSEIMRI